MLKSRDLFAGGLALAFTVMAAVTGHAGVAERADVAEQTYPAEPTRILSRKDAARLRGNHGITLQWIDWNTRGSVLIEDSGGAWTLRAAQAEAGGPGRLFLEGSITEIGEGYFTFEGLIRITDTPDRGRLCEKRKTWHFAITQNRPYYRLREFEWCDDLTDYIDIYFVPLRE